MKRLGRLDDLEGRLRGLGEALRLRERRPPAAKEDPFANVLARMRGDVLRLRWGSRDRESPRPR